MLIQTEATEDPASMKFLPGRPVLHEDKTVTFTSKEDVAAQSPMADKLFELDGVKIVTFGRDYIAVTSDGRSWDDLKPWLIGTIAEHLEEGGLVMASEAGAGAGVGHDQMVAEIEEALKLVIDPELGYNIVDIGLIYDIILNEGGKVHIVMTTTTKGCPATNYLRQGAEGAAWSVDGVEEVEVEMIYEPPWAPKMMSDEAKDYFGIKD